MLMASVATKLVAQLARRRKVIAVAPPIACDGAPSDKLHATFEPATTCWALGLPR